MRILMARLRSRVCDTLTCQKDKLLKCLFPVGDMLDILEQRHDWMKFNFTPELFKYVFLNLIPDVVMHTQNQDEEQVRDHYDRTYHSFLLLPLSF